MDALLDVRARVSGEKKETFHPPEDVNEALLKVAEKGSHPAVVSLLTEKAGGDFSSKTPEGGDALHKLLDRLDSPNEMLHAFLDIPGIEINAEDDLSEMPLINACRRGHVQAAGQLIKAGADIHDVHIDGDTALSMAALHEAVELVDML